MKTIKFNLLLLSIFAIHLMSCSRSRELVCVTYHLSILSDEPCEVFIAYKDSNEYVTLHTDKDWSKDVYLPETSYASLLVVPQNLDKSSEVFLLGRIVHRGKMLESLNKNLISIVMPNL